MSCSRTQRGDACGVRTQDLSIRSPTLYHYATALPKFLTIKLPLRKPPPPRLFVFLMLYVFQLSKNAGGWGWGGGLFSPDGIRHLKKVQVGKDQEEAQSEKDSHSRNRGGKN